MIEKLQNQFDSYDVYKSESTTSSVEFTSRRGITSAEQNQTRGLAIRAFQNGVMGFTSTLDFTNENKVIQNLKESIQFGQKVNYKLPTPSKNGEVLSGTRFLEISELREISEKLNERLKKVSSEFEFKGNLNSIKSKMALSNSNDVNIDQDFSFTYGIVQFNKASQNDVIIDGDHFDPKKFDDSEIDALIEKISKRIGLLKNLESLTPRKMPVVFSPQGTKILTSPLISHLNGYSIYQKVSPLIDKLGEKMFDEKFTILDDPTCKTGIGSRTHDDEGTKSTQMPFVENGVVKNFYHSLKTANLTNSEPTGHGMRGGINSLPSPSKSNILIKNGETNFEEMISDIKEGLLVDSVIGQGMANTLNGDFSNSVGMAFKIENGKVVGRVKGYAIAGNIYQMFKNINGISKETESFFGSYVAPYFRFDDMNVVGG